MKPPAQTRIEVPLNNGTVWQGTEAQLRRDHPDWLPYAIVVQATTIDVDEIEDKYFNTRLPSSARNYALLEQQGYTVQEHDQVISRHAIPPRRSAAQAAPPTDVPKTRRKPNPNKNTAHPPDVLIAQPARGTQKRRGGWHPLWYLGVGMSVMFALWVGLSWFGNWLNTTQNDMTYTKAFRTFSVDFAVGHNNDSSNPSHFIVQNDKRHIVIIELPADDASKAVIYTGPQLIGDGQNKNPCHY